MLRLVRYAGSANELSLSRTDHLRSVSLSYAVNGKSMTSSYTLDDIEPALAGRAALDLKFCGVTDIQLFL